MARFIQKVTVRSRSRCREYQEPDPLPSAALPTGELDCPPEYLDELLEELA